MYDYILLVHCSAGVGRTGTYIGLDMLTKEGEAELAIDITGCVHKMRQNRPNMVQTLVSYFCQRSDTIAQCLACVTLHDRAFSSSPRDHA